MASDLSIYYIFVPKEVPLSKIYVDVIACDLWFATPQSKILATIVPLAYSAPLLPGKE